MKHIFGLSLHVLSKLIPFNQNRRNSASCNTALSNSFSRINHAEKLRQALSFVALFMMIMASLLTTTQDPQNLTDLEVFWKAAKRKLQMKTYVNWFGPGWRSEGRDKLKSGKKASVDAMDELAMAHDFGYQIAEEQGAAYNKVLE